MLHDHVCRRIVALYYERMLAQAQLQLAPYSSVSSSECSYKLTLSAAIHNASYLQDNVKTIIPVPI